ncbi:MAG: ATP-binding protein [Thermoplasmatota archaeon]
MDLRHEAASTKARVAERGVGWVRAAVVVLNSAVYAIWLHPTGIPWLAWSIVVVANLYSVAIVLRPPQPGTALTSATWTATADAVLIGLWLTATGGPSSPFSLLWGLSIIAVAFRFDGRTTRWVTLAYMVSDLALLAAWGWNIAPPMLAIRIGYLGLMGLLSAFLATSNQDAWERERALAHAMESNAQTQSELEAVMESAPSIIIRCSVDGVIEYMNRVAPDFEGASLLGANVVDFVDEDGALILRDAMDHVRTHRKPTSYEIPAQNPEGGTLWYRSTMGPVLRNDALVGFVIVTQDVTQEKAQALEAEKVRTQQEEIERLEKQDAFRKRLLNGVAHELNTPLTPLRLQLATLDRKGTPGVDRLARNVNRLEQLVRDLLDLARLERGLSLRLESLDVRDALYEVRSNFAELADRRGILLQVAIDASKVHADSLRLLQVLNNLLSNAIRFSPDGTRIRIGAKQDGDGVAVFVEDQGLGLNPDEVDQVFQPFEQVHASLDPDMPGTGLGLHITQSIMAAHEGEVRVTSEGRGKGSTFSCWFPNAAVVSPQGQSHEPRA